MSIKPNQSVGRVESCLSSIIWVLGTAIIGYLTVKGLNGYDIQPPVVKVASEVLAVGLEAAIIRGLIGLAFLPRKNGVEVNSTSGDRNDSPPDIPIAAIEERKTTVWKNSGLK